MTYNESSGEILAGRYWTEDTKRASIAALDRNYLEAFRAQWVPLSVDTFGGVGTRLLFEMPRVSGTD